MRRSLLLSLVIVLSIASPASAAGRLSGVFFEIRHDTGSDTNGGGWAGPGFCGTSGTDYSQQDNAQYTLTNGSTTSGMTTILTSSASADMVCNIAYISGGSVPVTAGWYIIASVVVGTSITVDSSIGLTTATGVHITIGGALKNPQIVWPLFATQNAGAYEWIKCQSVYNISSATPNVANGIIQIGVLYPMIRTYQTTRGDDACVQQFKVTGAIGNVVPIGYMTGIGAGSPALYSGFSVDCQALTGQANAGGTGAGIAAFDGNGYNLAASNCNNSGIQLSFGNCVRCFASGNTGTNPQIAVPWCFGCEVSGGSAVGGGSPGFLGGGAPQSFSWSYSIVHDISGADCLSSGPGGAQWVEIDHVIGYHCGGNGVYLTTSYPFSVITNSIMENNGGYGYSISAPVINQAPVTMMNNAAELNASGPNDVTSILGTNAFGVIISPIYQSVSVFVDPTHGNFTLNHNSPGGQVLINAGFPGSFPDGNVGYTTIGPLQPPVFNMGFLADARRTYQTIEAALSHLPKSMQDHARSRMLADRHVAAPPRGLPDWGVFWGVGVLIAGATWLKARSTKER